MLDSIGLSADKRLKLDAIIDATEFEQSFVTETSQPGSKAGYAFDNTTFSAWGNKIEPALQSFDGIKLDIKENDTITQVRVMILDTDADGATLADVTVPYDNSSVDQTVEFGTTIASGTDCYVIYATDGKTAIRLHDGAYAPTDGAKYRTNKQLLPPTTDSTSHKKLWYELILSTGDGGLVVASDTPRLTLPDRIVSVVGQTRQLFYRGMIEAESIDDFELVIRGPGEKFNRYYEYTISSAGTQTLTVELHQHGTKVAEGTVDLVGIAVPANPGSVQRVLPIGDSLTEAANNYVKELERMVAQTGGTPAGDGLTNIQWIGTRGTSPANHEGWGGKSFSWFLDTSTSPFANGASIDFANYISTNAFGGLETCIIFLGWNGFGGNRSTADDNATAKGQAESLIAEILADYPSCNILLCGLQLPSINGGLPDDYDDDDSGYGGWLKLVRSVNGLNLAYQEIADANSQVTFVNLSNQFDCENNYPSTTKAVNSRSSTTESRHTNGIHPNADGYGQISDALIGSLYEQV